MDPEQSLYRETIYNLAKQIHSRVRLFVSEVMR